MNTSHLLMILYILSNPLQCSKNSCLMIANIQDSSEGQMNLFLLYITSDRSILIWKRGYDPSVVCLPNRGALVDFTLLDSRTPFLLC